VKCHLKLYIDIDIDGHSDQRLTHAVTKKLNVLSCLYPVYVWCMCLLPGGAGVCVVRAFTARWRWCVCCACVYCQVALVYVWCVRLLLGGAGVCIVHVFTARWRWCFPTTNRSHSSVHSTAASPPALCLCPYKSRS